MFLNNTTLVSNVGDVNDLGGIHSPRWIELLAGTWLVCLLVGGVTLNGLLIYTFIREKKSFNLNHVFPLLIMINGLCMASLAFIIPATAEFSGGFMKEMGEEACIVEAFIVYLLGIGSLFQNTAIAVNRYVVISRPSLSLRHSVRTVVLAAIGLELLAAAIAICPLLGWGSYGLELHGTSCGLAWNDRSPGALSYLVFIFMLCYILPIATITFSYVGIYRIVKGSAIRVRSESMAPSSQHRDKELKLVKLGTLLVAAFVICWTPYTIVSFYVVFGTAEDLNPFLSRSASLFAKSEVILNPVIFVYTMDDFRRKIFKMVPCFSKPEHASPPSTMTHTDCQSQVVATHSNASVPHTVSSVSAKVRFLTVKSAFVKSKRQVDEDSSV